MTQAQIEERFKDANKIEYTDDGRAFVFCGGAYPLVFDVEGKEG